MLMDVVHVKRVKEWPWIGFLITKFLLKSRLFLWNLFPLVYSERLLLNNFFLFQCLIWKWLRNLLFLKCLRSQLVFIRLIYEKLFFRKLFLPKNLFFKLFFSLLDWHLELSCLWERNLRFLFDLTNEIFSAWLLNFVFDFGFSFFCKRSQMLFKWLILDLLLYFLLGLPIVYRSSKDLFVCDKSVLVAKSQV